MIQSDHPSLSVCGKVSGELRSDDGGRILEEEAESCKFNQPEKPDALLALEESLIFF